MSISLHIESGRSVPEAKQRENFVVQLGCPAEKNYSIPLLGVLQGRHHPAFKVGMNPNLDVYDSPIRVIGLRVICEAPDAFLADCTDLVFTLVADDQRGDEAFTVDQGVHNEKDLVVFRLKQCADDFHDSFVTITESHKGLGVPNEIRWPSDLDKPIDHTGFDIRNRIVILDDDNDNGE